MNSHAQVPTVLSLPKQNIIRVYFSSRPRQNISLTSYVDLNSSNLSEINFLNPEPILELGGLGMFDEHGIMPSSVIKHEDVVFLYYSGWSTGTTLPYSNFTGLAISEDNGKFFKKLGKGPILDRTHWGPYSATSPHVIKNGNSWLMYYCSGTDWIDVDGKLEHVYNIKIAESYDGIKWEQSGKVAIPQSTKDEAITKPTIYFDGQIYHMYFCYRKSVGFRGGKNSYQIGYAQSKNLIDWKREDSMAGISKGPNKGDSEMIAYPEVCSIRNKICMFYNGNGFGEEGFFLATSDSSFSQIS
jgi:sucrose-6-phosphate hydrolase SacC (GH32 family)